MLQIQHNIDISKLNTLRLKSIANNYIVLNNINQLSELRQILHTYPKYFVLGGGSNIIVPKEYNGLIIHNQLLGKELLDSGEYFRVTALAGENWDNFVAWCLDNGAFGLENLSLIPGTVGASPVQNIGAYGVEVKDFIECIQIYDWNTGLIKYLSNEECKFTYRNSILKTFTNYLVLSVTFNLPKQSPLNCNYGDIKSQIDQIENPNGHDLRKCIIETRQGKLPNPDEIGNAGSFFHNPIISTHEAELLKSEYSKLPIYPTNNPLLTKISAGWLIDNLGLKGYRVGNMGVYHKQALVLVNHGKADKNELLSFAREIQNKVWLKYAVKLNIEPIII